MSRNRKRYAVEGFNPINNPSWGPHFESVLTFTKAEAKREAKRLQRNCVNVIIYELGKMESV